MANVTQEIQGSASPAKELTLEQQQNLIKEEIQRFIRLAKDKGFLVIEEINDLLPAEIVDASVLDALMQALEVNGVIITDQAAQKKEEGEGESAFLADPDKEVEEEAD